MKRLLQLVAVLLVALLAIPPAIGQGLCMLVQSGPMMDTDCCAGMGQGTTTGATPIAHAQSCAQGCCSVSPLNPPEQSIGDKAKVDSAAPGLAPAAVVLALPTAREFLSSSDFSGRATPRLHILLRTFRI